MQETGSGPTLLLLHGAGGSTHSFRDIIPLLAETHHVVAIDLPGQGFTKLGARHRCGLNEMAQDIEKLCDQESWQPSAILGHSAGGALALRLTQTMRSPQGQIPKIIGINPALDNFKGLAGVLFPVMAKILAALPYTAQFFSAASANPARIEALIKSTGSSLAPDGLELYRLLVADRNHVDATLLMMAQWNLDQLSESLHTIDAQTIFIVGDQDGAVPPAVSHTAAALMRHATIIEIAGKGHLVHEEAPESVTRHVLQFLNF